MLLPRLEHLAAPAGLPSVQAGLVLFEAPSNPPDCELRRCLRKAHRRALRAKPVLSARAALESRTYQLHQLLRSAECLGQLDELRFPTTHVPLQAIDTPHVRNQRLRELRALAPLYSPPKPAGPASQRCYGRGTEEGPSDSTD